MPIAVAAAIGCGALAARPALLATVPRPAATLAVLFGVLLAVGLVLPVPGDTQPRDTVPAHAWRMIPVALVVGTLTFTAGRLIAGGHSPAGFALPVVLANTLAALAEEVWFRRICFGLLAPAGPVFAVAGSTVLFAAVHVAVYGFWVLPLDLAAGAIFGWQRATTGSWAVPAATHVIANLLVIL